MEKGSQPSFYWGLCCDPRPLVENRVYEDIYTRRCVHTCGLGFTFNLLVVREWRNGKEKGNSDLFGVYIKLVSFL